MWYLEGWHLKHCKDHYAASYTGKITGNSTETKAAGDSIFRLRQLLDQFRKGTNENKHRFIIKNKAKHILHTSSLKVLSTVWSQS